MTDRGFRVDSGGRRPAAFDVATLPYPGFPTDLQPFALACNAVSAKVSGKQRCERRR